VQTLVYADVFDYALTSSEIHRYLIGTGAAAQDIQETLNGNRLVPHFIERHGEFYTLPGRSVAVAVRQRRQAIANRLWPHALRYGRLIARLPFVRMVAVTGALAVDNVEPEADIDLLVVTQPGRLWLCRALVIAVVKLARRRGDVICPNYFLSERVLELAERNLFTAHEFAQMVPLAGQPVYHHMRALNRWVEDFQRRCRDVVLCTATDQILTLRRPRTPPDRWDAARLSSRHAGPIVFEDFCKAASDRTGGAFWTRRSFGRSR
jgi:hypothetical protein